MDKYIEKYLAMADKNIAKYKEDGRANLAEILNKVYEDGVNDGEDMLMVIEGSETLDTINPKRTRQGLEDISIDD